MTEPAAQAPTSRFPEGEAASSALIPGAYRWASQEPRQLPPRTTSRPHRLPNRQHRCRGAAHILCRRHGDDGHLPGELGAGPLLVVSDVPKDVEPARYGDRQPVLVVDLSQQGAVLQLVDRHG